MLNKKIMEEIEKRIKGVVLYFPNSNEGDILEYEVGVSGVTEIKEVKRNPAEYCTIIYYEIWKGEFLFAEMYHYSLVIFFKNN